jgi:hypothetical protein
MEKRGQVTIFIVVGILIVVAIVLIFIFQSKLETIISGSPNPTQFIQNCVKDDLELAFENIIASGGVYYSNSNPEQFYLINNTRYAILCTTNASRTSCINQHPLLINEAQQTIRQEIISEVEGCFNQLRKKYPAAEISIGELTFDVELKENLVSVSINRPLSINSGEDSNLIEDFSFYINSKIYNFLDIASVIVNTESGCNCVNNLFTSNNSNTIYMPANGTTNPFLSPRSGCDADLSKMKKQYPNYAFNRVNIGSGEKVYTITSLVEPVQNFSFYIKNCFTGCNGPGGLCYHHYHVGDVVHYSNLASSCHNQIHHYHDESWEYVID